MSEEILTDNDNEPVFAAEPDDCVKRVVTNDNALFPDGAGDVFLPTFFLELADENGKTHSSESLNDCEGFPITMSRVKIGDVELCLNAWTSNGGQKLHLKLTTGGYYYSV